MHGAFGLGYAGEHGGSVGGDRLRQGQVGNRALDIGKAAVGVVMVGGAAVGVGPRSGRVESAVRRSFFYAVYGDTEMRARDAAFCGAFGVEAHVGDSQAVERAQSVGALVFFKQFVEGGADHVAGGSHAAIEVERGHERASTWLIILARYPAPKPLSMLTTDTPLAQELSIESRAERPPKEAP